MGWRAHFRANMYCYTHTLAQHIFTYAHIHSHIRTYTYHKKDTFIIETISCIDTQVIFAEIQRRIVFGDRKHDKDSIFDLTFRILADDS